MKKLLLISLLTVLSSTALASDWINIANGKSNSYSINLQSFEFSKNESGKIFGAIIKNENTFNNQVDLSYGFINPKECNQIKGSLYYYGLDNHFISKLYWVKGSDTIASSIAETICLGLKDDTYLSFK